MPIRDFDEFLRSIIATLENLGFQYAIGGSVASSCYGEPRSTFDVDISVRLPLEEANRFVQAFQSLGYYADLEAVVDAFIYHQPFNIIDAESGFKADIFLIDPDEPSELEQSAMARRRREVYDPDTGAKTYLYAPEDVIIYKLKYYLFSHTHGRKGRRPRFSGDFPAEAGLPTDFSQAHFNRQTVFGLLFGVLDVEPVSRLTKLKLAYQHRTDTSAPGARRPRCAQGNVLSWQVWGQVVEELLRRSGRLPQPGARLVRRDGALTWEVTPDKLAERITDVTVGRVRLTSGAPLLMSALDDDPTCRAEVNMIVTTADGQEIPLSVELWDYGLLTLWSFRPRGDGWKPVQVHWPETGGQGPSE